MSGGFILFLCFSAFCIFLLIVFIKAVPVAKEMGKAMGQGLARRWEREDYIDAAVREKRERDASTKKT